MARVTVEDCKEKVPNRFDLVLVASQRAKLISSGALLTIARDNDKDTVVGLREIAAGSVNPPELREMIILSMQRNPKIEDEEDEVAVEVINEEDMAEINMSFNDNVSEEDLEGFEEIDFEEEKK